MKPNDRNGFGLLEMVIILGVIALIAGGGWYTQTLLKEKTDIQAGNNALSRAQELQQMLDRQAGEQVNQIQALEKLQSPKASTALDTSGWKTYRNEEYGFEVKYPTSWYFREFKFADSRGVLVGFDGNPLPHNFGGKVRISAEQRTLDDAIMAANGSMYEPGPDEAYERTTTTMNGMAATKLTYGNGKEVYWLGHDELAYSLFESSSTSNGQTIFSTFKFIQPLDTSNWQTYRNEEYGFEVKYPTDATVSSTGNEVSILHTKPWSGYGPCDMRAERKLTTWNDLDVSIELVSEDLMSTVKERGKFGTWNFLLDGSVSEQGSNIEKYLAGSVYGYRTQVEVEGGGAYEYFFPVTSQKTFYVLREYCVGSNTGPTYDALLKNIFSTLRLLP